MNSAVDGNLLFTLHPGKKWSEVEDVAELYAGTQVDLRSLFGQVRDILDGWKFEHHDVMRDYLAAWILSLPIQRAMGMVNITFLTGESTSGKTSLVRGLLGGYGSSGYDVPYIVESAKYSSDATAAWIYQEMDQTALLLSLDEAEARQDNAHSSRVADHPANDVLDTHGRRTHVQRRLIGGPAGGLLPADARHHGGHQHVVRPRCS